VIENQKIENPNTVGDVRQGAFIDDYLPYLLVRASHLISSTFHEKLKPKGLTVQIWRVLATLSDGDGMSIGQLARITLIKQPTLTKIIDRMERDHLVERLTGASDRRMVHVHITETGRELVSPLLLEAKEYEKDVLSDVSPAEQAEIKDILRKLIHKVAE